MTPNYVIIDLNAIRHNFREIRKVVGSRRGIIAVIKSDAYGHGMIPVAEALAMEDPAYFGVFELDEALTLAGAGCKVPVLILMGVRQEEVPEVVEKGFTVCLFHEGVARELSNQALSQGVVAPVHVKVDTGMTRLGVPWTELPAFLDLVVSLRGLHLTGICTHFAASDEPENDFTERQEERLLSAITSSSAVPIGPEMLHVANSGAILTGKGTTLDMVRPGLALYGSSPDQGGSEGRVRLKRAMTFTSSIIQVREVPAGTPVSYGGTYVTDTPATIATIPVGYDDGYNRLLSNRGEVLVHGRRVPVVGRVCMNLTMIDVSSLHGVEVGDEVILLGSQGSEEITAEEIAAKVGTISYEVYCSIGKSNPRRYLSTDDPR